MTLPDRLRPKQENACIFIFKSPFKRYNARRKSSSFMHTPDDASHLTITERVFGIPCRFVALQKGTHD